MSVRPSGNNTSCDDRDSVPGRTTMFLLQAKRCPFSAVRIPSLSRSVIATSLASGLTSEEAVASSHPAPSVAKIAAAMSGASCMYSRPKGRGASYSILTRCPREAFSGCGVRIFQR